MANLWTLQPNTDVPEGGLLNSRAAPSGQVVMLVRTEINSTSEPTQIQTAKPLFRWEGMLGLKEELHLVASLRKGICQSLTRSICMATPAFA